MVVTSHDTSIMDVESFRKRNWKVETSKETIIKVSWQHEMISKKAKLNILQKWFLKGLK